MSIESISVQKIRDILTVTVPPEPDDETINTLQTRVLDVMENNTVKGLILDISTVETLDSFFARTIVETGQMVDLMGGRTIICGMRPSVAITATQLGVTLGKLETSLNMDRAFALFAY
ncbi:STAS domain-containing protein [Dethiosulfatarculus sandiegensis]|uniref:Anti-anti-sigma factor n=1 Tax=Dethiosulfatarculus sandiegensis TaxID=1429043 RepID=A0A0D2G829_9BACT|nr:STAS domain-containing protein [Dethiosulfatarculus sandiegensis]KIX11097.1 anti-anti-sigma factor [Dethiosulfatarculus sandiegensis]